MLDRVVTIALAIAVACFILIVVWPAFEDDPPTFSQSVFVTSGTLFVTFAALVYWRHSR